MTSGEKQRIYFSPHGFVSFSKHSLRGSSSCGNFPETGALREEKQLNNFQSFKGLRNTHLTCLDLWSPVSRDHIWDTEDLFLSPV